ncbi:MAG: YbfB/YjiJ family MFS transporter [Candidatus Paceibacteria bacterium]
MHYAWVIALTGTLVTILAHGFGRMSYSVILPSMREGLKLTYTQLGSIATGNFIGYLSLAIIGGFWIYKRGSDPNNFLIPITTSVADFSSLILFSLLVAFLF